MLRSNSSQYMCCRFILSFGHGRNRIHVSLQHMFNDEVLIQSSLNIYTDDSILVCYKKIYKIRRNQKLKCMAKIFWSSMIHVLAKHIPYLVGRASDSMMAPT